MILVAEDNEINQIVIEHSLMDAGYTFVLVENGRLAVDYYKEHKPPLILMDISMPEMDGLEATRAIRALEEFSGDHTIIIGLSAHAMEEDRRIAMKAGMDDYTSKPVSPGRLAETIESWLGEAAAAVTASR